MWEKLNGMGESYHTEIACITAPAPRGKEWWTTKAKAKQCAEEAKRFLKEL
jgi:hypothetical protein